MTTAISMGPKEDWEECRVAIEPEGLATAALTSIEPLDLVPHLYTYSVLSCMLPIRNVQNDLVALYFNHIHPMFPVVDEHHFFILHQEHRGHEELMDAADFMIYYSVIVAGFSVLMPLCSKR